MKLNLPISIPMKRKNKLKFLFSHFFVVPPLFKYTIALIYLCEMYGVERTKEELMQLEINETKILKRA